MRGAAAPVAPPPVRSPGGGPFGGRDGLSLPAGRSAIHVVRSQGTASALPPVIARRIGSALASGCGGRQTPAMPLHPRDAAISFYRMRQALGWLGLALPVVLIGGTLAMGETLPPALSDFYYTPLGDIFVGIMVTIGFFLLTYLGHVERAIVSDANVSSAAGIAALGVALFPNDTLDACATEWVPDLSLPGMLHVVSAGVFLASTAVFCLVLFRRHDGGTPGPAKRRRNRIYLLCGAGIGLALLGLAIYFAVLAPAQRCALRGLRPVLWLEVMTVVAFGLSWLVKGRGIQGLNHDDAIAPLIGTATPPRDDRRS